MTEIPKYLELYLEHTVDGEDGAVFGCPVAPCPHVLKVTAPGLTKGYSPVLRLGADDEDLDEIDHPDEAVREALAFAEGRMSVHVEQTHTWADWLIAMQINDDTWEHHLGDAYAESDRAWANARSAQESLLEARQGVTDLKLALSHNQGALSSVREIAQSMRGMMISPDAVTGSVAALLQIVGTDESDTVPTYVQAVRRLSALEDARTAVLRYLDLFDDTADGLRRTVQAFLGEMPHQHDQVASAMANLRTTVRELERSEFGPQNAARLWQAVTGLLTKLDHPATSPEENHGHADRPHADA